MNVKTKLNLRFPAIRPDDLQRAAHVASEADRLQALTPTEVSKIPVADFLALIGEAAVVARKLQSTEAGLKTLHVDLTKEMQKLQAFLDGPLPGMN